MFCEQTNTSNAYDRGRIYEQLHNIRACASIYLARTSQLGIRAVRAQQLHNGILWKLAGPLSGRLQRRPTCLPAARSASGVMPMMAGSTASAPALDDGRTPSASRGGDRRDESESVLADEWVRRSRLFHRC